MLKAIHHQEDLEAARIIDKLHTMKLRSAAEQLENSEDTLTY